MLITDAAVKNRTTVGVLVVLIVVMGVSSYVTVPREAAPDVPTPFIIVSTSYRGVSPQDLETSVTMKIEKELAGMKGLKELRSSSAEGMSTITAEFQPDVDVEDALQRVRDRVDLAKAELPKNDDIEEPVVKEVNIAEFPIMIINISGDVSPVTLKFIADRLEDRIEAVPGVLRVDISGELEREIRLEIDPDRVTAYGLTVLELMALIPSANVNVSAGGLETAGVKFNVRVPAEIERPDEVDEFLLAVRDGKPIYLTDVAVVRDTFKDRQTISRLDGRNSISVLVRKRIGSNILSIAAAVKRILAKFREGAPRAVKFELVQDQSSEIELMVKDLENNILSGLVLVALVLALFMGIRTSVIVALAIPLSMLMSFSILQAMGHTLNMVVLFSLILALGMLVDNAIVIVENIFRHSQLGAGRVEAAVKGAAEVAWPVTTSTATTVAAFSPMLFWPGIVGEFMKYLPITLIVTLSSSLFVALVISPTVCSIVGRTGTARRRGESAVVRGYRRLLRAALGHGLSRVTTLTVAACLLFGLVTLYFKRGHEVEFFPKPDPDRAIVNVRFPQGTNINETDRLVRIIEGRVEQRYRGEADNILVNVGGSGGGGFFGGGGPSGPHEGEVTLLFPDFEDRKRPSAEILKEMRELVSDLPGAEIKVERPQEGPPTGAAVTVRIVGWDFKELARLSAEARRLIADTPGLVNLRSDLEATRPELVFRVDRRVAALNGVSAALVGDFLKTAVFGVEVGTYRQFNDEYDITIRLPLNQRTNIEDMLRLQVPNASGKPVPLSSLGRFEYKGGFGTIYRVNQDRVVTLTGDAEGRQETAVLADAQKRLEKLELPTGYEIRYAGQKEEQDKASAFLTKAYVFALLLIIMILVAQFNTLTVPLIIMSTVVLSLVGVFAGLLICGMPFGIIMTGIGVIGLAGVVVNNAIVLLDCARRLRAEGMGLVDAAVQAGATRFRPVLLTAATTILGLVPMATGVSFDFHVMQWVAKSESSQWWASMAIAVIFGLGFATMLTLIVVPTFYVFLASVTGAIKSALGMGAAQVCGPAFRETADRS